MVPFIFKASKGTCSPSLASHLSDFPTATSLLAPLMILRAHVITLGPPNNTEYPFYLKISLVILQSPFCQVTEHNHKCDTRGQRS